MRRIRSGDMAGLRLRPFRRVARAGVRALVTIPFLLVVGGCEVENPTRVIPENAEPVRLLEGMMTRLEELHRTIVAGIFVASDEGRYGGTNVQIKEADETGDLSVYAFFQGRYPQFTEARVLTEIAIETAKKKRLTMPLRKAHAWHGWILIRMAEIWGAQPLVVGGPHVPQEEIFELAREDFEAVIEGGPLLRPDTLPPEQQIDAPLDSAYIQALAGIARINYNLGRSPVNPELLQEAIEKADEALMLDPNFYHLVPVRSNTLRSSWGTSYIRNPPYQYITPWWSRSATIPQGWKLIDKDELWLIKAEAKLLLGDLNGAKQTLKQTPLLADNLVGLGRQRTSHTQPLLTEQEINDLLDPLDEEGVLFVIRELQRENQFTHGRRAVSDQGTPIFPVKLPPEVF